MVNIKFNKKSSFSINIFIAIGLCLIGLNTCTKDKFPRITKFKIVHDTTCRSNRALEIIDLSDMPNDAIGVQYDSLRSFISSSTSFYPRPDKGARQCIEIPKFRCGSIIYLKPFCKEGDHFIFGPLDSISFTTMNFGLANITSISISNNVSELIVYYKLPDLTNISNIEGLYLYYSINSKNPISLNDSSIEIKDPTLKSYTLKPIQKGSTYKFKLFIKICGSINEFSSDQEIFVPTGNSPCTINFGTITFQQKSASKVLLNGSIFGNPQLQDFGFCIDGCNNKKISCKNQSFSNYDSIFSGINGNSYNCKLYAQCSGKSSLEEGPESRFAIKSPNISISTPIYVVSNKTISVSGGFNISNYPSVEYGVCFSISNQFPIISNSTKVLLGSGIVPPTLSANITNALSRKTYYLRYYIQDCDDVLYSEVKSIYTDASLPSCNILFSNIEKFPSPANFPAAFILDGNLYAGGGLGTTFNSLLFYMFDGQKWNRLLDIPISLTSINNGGIAAYFTINSKAYILERNTSKFIEYNHINNLWNTLSSYSGKREYCTGASTGNRGYIIGGKYTNSTISDNSIYEFIVSANKWEKRTYDTNLGPRIKSGSFVINNTIYIFGGEGQEANNKLWSYNTDTDTWTQNNPMLPSQLLGFVSGLTFVLNGRGYVIKQNTTEVWEFDPSVGWSKCSIMFNSKQQFGFGVYNMTSAYIGLGSTSTGLSNEVFKVN